MYKNVAQIQDLVFSDIVDKVFRWILGFPQELSDEI